MSTARLIQIMREEGAVSNPELIYLGEVSSSSPLKVKLNNIELDNDQLKKIDNQVNQTFQLNDKVLLINKGSFFIVIGKVVGA